MSQFTEDDGFSKSQINFTFRRHLIFSVNFVEGYKLVSDPSVKDIFALVFVECFSLAPFLCKDMFVKHNELTFKFCQLK